MIKLVSLFTLVSLFAVGCAAADEGEDRPVDTVEAVVEPGNAEPAYLPRVTRKDLEAAGASCAGDLCSINGQMWDCRGGGYCSRIFLQ